MRGHVLAIVRNISARGLGALRRRAGLPAAVILAVALLAGYRYVSGQETLDAFIFSQSITRGKANSLLSGLNLLGKNPELVYLGSYLVNGQTGCNQCHTCPTYRGIDPYKVGGQSLAKINPNNTLNQMAGGTPFNNSTIITPNLTPNLSGMPGGMNYADFSDAMRNGTSFHKPGHVLQVMPWPEFRNMNESEMLAIYQYLSSLPPAQPGSCTGPGQSAN